MEYVVLGAGPAGVTAAETLRGLDGGSSITLIGGEPEPPYSRMAIPYLLAGLGAKFRIDQLGTLDNTHPRVQANELRDVAARAYAAQQNAWEALAVFTAAVVVAHLAGADAGTSATASLVFIAARILHPIAYIANQPTLRSVIFFIGFVSCLTLFGSAIRA